MILQDDRKQGRPFISVFALKFFFFVHRSWSSWAKEWKGQTVQRGRDKRLDKALLVALVGSIGSKQFFFSLLSPLDFTSCGSSLDKQFPLRATPLADQFYHCFHLTISFFFFSSLHYHLLFPSLSILISSLFYDL